MAVQTSAKAVVAAIWGGVTGVISSLTVVLVGDATLQTISQGQWLAVIAAAVAGVGGGFGLTWATSNAPAVPAIVVTPASSALQGDLPTDPPTDGTDPGIPAT